MQSKKNQQYQINIRELLTPSAQMLTDLKTALSNQSSCQFIVPLYMCRSYGAVAELYLELAFITEELSKCSTVESVTRVPAEEVTKFGAYELEIISVYYSDSDKLITKAIDIVDTIYGDGFEESFEELNALLDIPTKPFTHFTAEYIDAYYANYIVSNCDWGDDGISETLKSNPEWQFHTWKSAFSSHLKAPLYVSPYFWLLPKFADWKKALSSFGNIKITSPLMKSKRYIELDGTITICCGNQLYVIDANLFFIFRSAGALIFPNPDNSFHARYDSFGTGDFYYSRDNSYLIFSTTTYRCILFRNSFSPTGYDSQNTLTHKFEFIAKDLLQQSGLCLATNCNWQKLNDEEFETLCYELIIRDGRFDPSETKKMGKARARDGGRDIITRPYKRIGSWQKDSTWIVQCKFSTKKNSLGRNSIILSDLIDEYKPDGIIIATNTLIDSGAYDKFAKICENRDVVLETWSDLDIRRRLFSASDLMNKYFSSK